MEKKWSIETPRKVFISILYPLNGVFHFMESYWSHYGVFNQVQLEKNEFSVVLMEFCIQLLPYNGDFLEFLDIIMEFLWNFLYHKVESVWSLEILIQNLAPQCGVFMESLPDTRYHYQIMEFFFLTLTPFNGILLEFC